MKFKVTNAELSRAYLGNPSFQKFIELEGELVEEKPSVELPRELPELSLDTEEERDQYASISINRRAINQLIKYLKAKGI